MSAGSGNVTLCPLLNMPVGKVNIGKFFGITGPVGWVLWIMAAAALAANWLAVTIFLALHSGTSGFLRLHYTVALGVDWVAEWWKIFLYPGVGLAAFFINGFFSGILAKKHRMLGSLALGSTAAVEILLAIGGILAIMLND